MFNHKISLSPDQRNLFSLKYPWADNYQTNYKIIASIFRKVGWKGLVDPSSDIAGANSTAPFCYSAMEDGTQQAAKVAGLDLIVNPAFDLA